MNNTLNPESVSAGVVGLGLMGSSIVTALLIAGHQVKAVSPIPADLNVLARNFENQLLICEESGLLINTVSHYLSRLYLSEEYSILEDCGIVIECVIEDFTIKSQVYKNITNVVSNTTVISTNTSAIPISELQKLVSYPERFLGIHWAEPAYLTRFLEVICGKDTSAEAAGTVMELAKYWGKEPTLLKKDIRGFITNRLMYAVYRELFALIEKEGAPMEALDKAFRYDPGSWMTLMGVFRRADYQGLDDFAATMENLFPKLSNSAEVPAIMQQVVEEKRNGIYNQNGLFQYSKEEAQEWEEAFSRFSSDITKLSIKYSGKKIKDLTKN
jgi:3-hydroxybutyryl-CoA dehydrogenase